MELMLSAAILGVAICAMPLLFAKCSALNNANRNVSTAISHAQYVLENIEDAQFTTLATNINAGVWNWSAVAINTTGLTPLTNETITTQATGTEPLDITVTVRWTDRIDNNRNVTIETLQGAS